MPFQPRRLFARLWRSLAVVLFALFSTVTFTTGAVQAATHTPSEGSNCNNNQPCATLSYQDSTGATHQLTDSNGVAVDPTAEHITSGDALTVHGKRWDPNTAFQVWLSAPFVDLSKEPSNNECYVRVDASSNPNADGSFTRSIALPDLDPTTFPNGAYFTLEVGSPGIGCLNSDQVGNSEELGEDAEVNSYEVSFKAYAKPPAPPCTVGQNSPCLT